MLVQRIGVVGDVHTEHQALEAALRFLKAMPIDVLLCTGDIPTGRGDVNRCCQLLQEFGVTTVRGNHDRWFLARTMSDLPESTREEEVGDEAHAFLAALPTTRSYDTVQGRLLLCHGLGDDDMAGVFPYDYGYALEANYKLHALCKGGKLNFVINGHTHHRMVRAFDHLTIINAGTLRRSHEPCFLTADFESGVVQFYDIGQHLEITQAGTFEFKKI